MSQAPPRPSRTRRTYYEMVFEGNPERTRGILVGLRIGAGDGGGELYFSYEEGVSCSFGEKILGIVGHAAVHAIVDSAMRTLIKRHRKVLESEHAVTIVEEKRIRSARLDFRYQAYARRYGEEILEVIKKLPRGLKVEGGEPKETVDESARGLEKYSPTHHYEIEGRGVVRGRIDLVIEARHLLAAHPLIHVGSVDMDFA